MGEPTSREIEERMVQLHIDSKKTEGQAVGDDELEQFRMEWRQEVKSRLPPREQPSDILTGPHLGAYPQPGQLVHSDSIGQARSKDGEHALPPTSPRSDTSPRGSYKSLSPVTSPLSIKPGLPEDKLSGGSRSGPSRSPEKDKLRFFRTTRRVRDKGDAVSIYERAVEAEQAGQLNDALNLYRQAFKLDGGYSPLFVCYHG